VIVNAIVNGIRERVIPLSPIGDHVIPKIIIAGDPAPITRRSRTDPAGRRCLPMAATAGAGSGHRACFRHGAMKVST
jgi:hypothetical protein